MNTATPPIYYTRQGIVENFGGKRVENYHEITEKIKWNEVIAHAVSIASKRLSSPVTQIMDLATGAGGSAPDLRQAFQDATITGVDLVEKSLAHIKEQGYIDRDLVADIRELTQIHGGLEDRFDLTTMFGASEFIAPNEMGQVIQQISDVTKGNGIAVITFEPVGTKNRGVKANQHDLDGLKDLFTAYGFADVEAELADYKAWGDAKKRKQEDIDTTIMSAVKLTV